MIISYPIGFFITLFACLACKGYQEARNRDSFFTSFGIGIASIFWPVAVPLLLLWAGGYWAYELAWRYGSRGK